MKTTLIILTLIFSTFARCEMFEEYYISDASGRWIEYTTYEGQHGSVPKIINRVNSVDSILTLEFQFCFPDSTFAYDIGEEQSDWNKLFGVVPFFNYIHNNSYRFVWRYLNGELQIGYYSYVNSPYVIKGLMGVIETGRVYDAKIIVTPGRIIYSLNDETIELEQKAEVFTTWHIATPWFGGSEVAPHDVNISIKCNQLVK